MDFKDQSIYRDPRLSNLVNYAIITECEIYEQAKDQEEYFYLLAERIYKIQTEYDRQRMNLDNNENNNCSNDSIQKNEHILDLNNKNNSSSSLSSETAPQAMIKSEVAVVEHNKEQCKMV